MGMVERFEQELELYRKMYSVCVELLKFEKNSDMKKYKLRMLGKEVIEHGNKNRIKTIAKKVSTAWSETFIGAKEVEEAIKHAGLDIDSSEVRRCIHSLRTNSPQEYMIECLTKVLELKNNIKIAKENEKKGTKQSYSYKGIETEKVTRSYDHVSASKMSQSMGKAITSANRMASTGTIASAKANNKVSINEIKSSKTLKEIIKNHLRDNNPYLERDEIEQIKEEFKIDLFRNKDGYLSNDTIEKLFIVRIVSDQMDNNEEVNIKGIADAMDALYDLALIEMPYQASSEEYGTQGAANYERVLHNIKPVIARDYVNEYAALYNKVMETYRKFSQNERDMLSKYIQLSKLMRGEKVLPTPEVFRKRVNETAKLNISWNMAAYNKPYKVADIVSGYLKYMTAEELSKYYKELREKYSSEDLQEIFVMIIERRMSHLDIDMPEIERRDELERRYKAICSEYLKEEPVSIGAKETKVRANYAQSDIEINAAQDRIDKKYFNEKKDITMNFKRLKEKSRLKKFEKQGILTGEELEEVKGLGR